MDDDNVFKGELILGGMDRIAYTGSGKPHLVSDSPASISPELEQMIIVSLKSQGVSDVDIPARLEQIDAEMMEIEIANIRVGKGVILNLTQETAVPRDRQIPFYDDGENRPYVHGDRRAAMGLRNNGMHMITSKSILSQSRTYAAMLTRCAGDIARYYASA